MRTLRSLLFVFCTAGVAGCTTAPEAVNNNDPLEPMNRAVYNFDEKVDQYALLPIAGLYLNNVPKGVRGAIHNVFANAEEPVTIINDTLQLKLLEAGRMTVRLALNSTIGIGGIVDVAAKHDLDDKQADFGQTLDRYGIGEGPFLVLPVIGPDPPRDLIGDAADLFIDPLTWLPDGWPLLDRVGLTAGVHVWDPYVTHARDIFLRRELEKGSLDPYATMRSTYRQIRADEINGGAPVISDK
ncbi:MAG TPA: VacJ family lipoprotein [Rhizomicrobium sp.]|jgi:phospholipid-binding lipoprotein MlaA|nr:VacJ family lipoprotein [Rhizomicrobium sp.]